MARQTYYAAEGWRDRILSGEIPAANAGNEVGSKNDDTYGLLLHIAELRGGAHHA